MSSLASNSQTVALEQEQRPSKMPKIESIDISTLQHDLGLRPQMWEYLVNQQDEIRRAYLKAGRYRFIPSNSYEYPFSGNEKNRRRFQSSWHTMFDWLEFSPEKDATYCLPCYIFCKRSTRRFGAHAFTIEGFRNWKKVNDGVHCVFLGHMGNGSCSPHNNAVKGHDEGPDSKDRDNFLELIKFMSAYNEDVAKVVLENAPGNAKFTSCSKRYFTCLCKKDSFIRERFFDIVSVKDTTKSTLKDSISYVLSENRLDIQSIRGQGYDGASNMLGEWKELLTLFHNDCPCAYYVHCFAHRLQFALVAAYREVVSIHEFFSNLNFIINVVGASCKHHDQLQDAHETDIAHLIAIDELETRK
ncbi:uncharacterized protein LOC132174277 [Corylus avellana]|uniref:uncharacterized protein LOC132174277 n=1 Tax=Corylus avellana TaxID=13451 RepID=UPI00286CC7C3|nr:uncharacterized protein LOC132174277 [Corylus avellana]